MGAKAALVKTLFIENPTPCKGAEHVRYVVLLFGSVVESSNVLLTIRRPFGCQISRSSFTKNKKILSINDRIVAIFEIDASEKS
jgi:hypothetical protein